MLSSIILALALSAEKMPSRTMLSCPKGPSFSRSETIMPPSIKTFCFLRCTHPAHLHFSRISTCSKQLYTISYRIDCCRFIFQRKTHRNAPVIVCLWTSQTQDIYETVATLNTPIPNHYFTCLFRYPNNFLTSILVLVVLKFNLPLQKAVPPGTMKASL